MLENSKKKTRRPKKTDFDRQSIVVFITNCGGIATVGELTQVFGITSQALAQYIHWLRSHDGVEIADVGGYGNEKTYQIASVEPVGGRQIGYM